MGITLKEDIKKTAVIFLLVFGIIGCDTGNSPSVTPPAAPNNKPIVCLGDSLTEGYGASSPGAVDKSNSYPAFLQKKVSIQVINAGISGDTSADALARTARDVLSNDPQLVIILLGGNDFLRRRDAEQAKKDLQAIIDMVRGGGREVYLASFIGDAAWEAAYLELIPDILNSGVIELLGGYKKIYAELRAKNTDIGFIPNIWAGIDSTNMSDPIHPNAKGYNKMADNIFNEIKPYLQSNNLLKYLQ